MELKRSDFKNEKLFNDICKKLRAPEHCVSVKIKLLKKNLISFEKGLAPKEQLEIWNEQLIKSKNLSKTAEIKKNINRLVFKLWDDFYIIEANGDERKLQKDFLHFPTGTDKNEVYNWFNQYYPVTDLFMGVHKGIKY